MRWARLRGESQSMEFGWLPSQICPSGSIHRLLRPMAEHDATSRTVWIRMSRAHAERSCAANTVTTKRRVPRQQQQQQIQQQSVRSSSSSSSAAHSRSPPRMRRTRLLSARHYSRRLLSRSRNTATARREPAAAPPAVTAGTRDDGAGSQLSPLPVSRSTCARYDLAAAIAERLQSVPAVAERLAASVEPRLPWRSNSYSTSTIVEGQAPRTGWCSRQDRSTSHPESAPPLATPAARLLELPGIGADAFEAVLEWLYCGEVGVVSSLLPAVLDASVKLELAHLQYAVAKALEDNLSAATCLETWEAAETHGLAGLAEASKTVALREFDALCHLDAFATLSAERLRALLADPRLDSSRSEYLLNGLVTWLGHQRAPNGGLSSPPISPQYGLLHGHSGVQRRTRRRRRPCLRSARRAIEGSRVHGTACVTAYGAATPGTAARAAATPGTAARAAAARTAAARTAAAAPPPQLKTPHCEVPRAYQHPSAAAPFRSAAHSVPLATARSSSPLASPLSAQAASCRAGAVEGRRSSMVAAADAPPSSREPRRPRPSIVALCRRSRVAAAIAGLGRRASRASAAVADSSIAPHQRQTRLRLQGQCSAAGGGSSTWGDLEKKYASLSASASSLPPLSPSPACKARQAQATITHEFLMPDGIPVLPAAQMDQHRSPLAAHAGGYSRLLDDELDSASAAATGSAGADGRRSGVTRAGGALCSRSCCQCS